MLIPLLSYMQDRLPFGNSLKGISPAMLKDFMRMTKAPHWHEYAIRQRQWRRHACTACRWLCGVLPRDAAIFEPGCGSAANLLWLGQKGFRRLSGSDISPEALDLGMQLAGSLHLPLDVWHDDALHPMRLPQQLDGILSVKVVVKVAHAHTGALGDFVHGRRLEAAVAKTFARCRQDLLTQSAARSTRAHFASAVCTAAGSSGSSCEPPPRTL